MNPVEAQTLDQPDMILDHQGDVSSMAELAQSVRRARQDVWVPRRQGKAQAGNRRYVECGGQLPLKLVDLERRRGREVNLRLV